MKKLFAILTFSVLLPIGLSANNNTNTGPNNSAGNLDNGQNPNKSKVEKKEKYDFSLFKFTSPSKTETKTDSVKQDVPAVEKKSEFNEATTDVFHDSPRCFLMFS